MEFIGVLYLKTHAINLFNNYFIKSKFIKILSFANIKSMDQYIQ